MKAFLIASHPSPDAHITHVLFTNPPTPHVSTDASPPLFSPQEGVDDSEVGGSGDEGGREISNTREIDRQTKRRPSSSSRTRGSIISICAAHPAPPSPTYPTSRTLDGTKTAFVRRPFFLLFLACGCHNSRHPPPAQTHFPFPLLPSETDVLFSCHITQVLLFVSCSVSKRAGRNVNAALGRRPSVRDRV